MLSLFQNPAFPWFRLRQLFGATSCGPKSVDHGGQGQAQRHLTENVFGEVPMCPKDSWSYNVRMKENMTKIDKKPCLNLLRNLQSSPSCHRVRSLSCHLDYLIINNYGNWVKQKTKSPNLINKLFQLFQFGPQFSDFSGLPPLPSEDPAARNGRCDGCNEGNISCSVVQLPWRPLMLWSFSCPQIWAQLRHAKNRLQLFRSFWILDEKRSSTILHHIYIISISHQVAAFWSPKNLIWRFVAGLAGLAWPPWPPWPIYRMADWTVGPVGPVGRSPPEPMVFWSNDPMILVMSCNVNPGLIKFINPGYTAVTN